MLDHSCQVQRHPHAERGLDLYETPAVAVRALLRVEQIPRRVWEPAAGRGAIVDVLRAAGHEVFASDIADYGDPTHSAGRDFLAEKALPAGIEAVVTNPPFRIVEEFVAHALDLCPRVIMLLRLAFLESDRRRGTLEGRGLARVHVFRKRLPMMHRDGWEGRKANSGMAFAWYVWDANHVGPTTIDRISWEREEKPWKTSYSTSRATSPRGVSALVTLASTPRLGSSPPLKTPSASTTGAASSSPGPWSGQCALNARSTCRPTTTPTSRTMTIARDGGPVASTLAAFAAGNTRMFDGRAQTVGASEVGQCARKIFYLKNEGSEFGAARDPDHVDSWGATVRGSIFESAFFVPALRARYGDRLLYAGDEQRTLAHGFLSATPDALIVALERDALAPLGIADIGGDGALAIEAKTIDPRTALGGPKPEHVFQAQVQLGLIRAQTEHRPEYALIAYTNASFWDDTVEFAVRFDAEVFANAQRRAAKILTARAAGELKPEGWIAGGRECERCPYARACGIVRANVPTGARKPSPQLAADIVALAREAKQREAALDAATARLREVHHTIKGRMGAAGVRRVVADGVSVLWSPIKGRPAYDMPKVRAACAAAGIDVTQFETVGLPTDRLVIKVIGQ
jgi:hypothetical protein